MGEKKNLQIFWDQTVLFGFGSTTPLDPSQIITQSPRRVSLSKPQLFWGYSLELIIFICLKNNGMKPTPRFHSIWIHLHSVVEHHGLSISWVFSVLVGLAYYLFYNVGDAMLNIFEKVIKIHVGTKCNQLFLGST